jgi:hypothetical protein
VGARDVAVDIRAEVALPEPLDDPALRGPLALKKALVIFLIETPLGPSQYFIYFSKALLILDLRHAMVA